jgi:integrase
MVHVTERPDGSKVATLVYEDPITGEKKRKYFSGKTRTIVNRKYEDFVDKLKAQISVTGKGLTVSQWIDKWWAGYAPTVSTSTQRVYKGRIEGIRRDLGSMLLKNVRTSDLQTFISEKAGKSKTIIRGYDILLRSIFRTAQNDRLVASDPTVGIKLPKAAPEGSHKYLEKEYQDVIAATWREHRLGPAAMLMLHAGLRISEAAAFDCSRHVDWDRNVIKIEEALKKTIDSPYAGEIGDPKDDSFGEVPICPELVEVLRSVPGRVVTKVDGTPVSAGCLQMLSTSYSTFLETKVNGVEKRKATPEQLANWKEVNWRTHDSRATFTTNCFERGVSVPGVREWLRQKSAEPLWKAYLKYSGAARDKDTAIFTGQHPDT